MAERPPSTLSEHLAELERTDPAVAAAAASYDRTVWRLNMRARIQLRHLFELMAGRPTDG